MKRNAKHHFIVSGIIFVLFVALSLALTGVDVQPIGPMGTNVGLAALNGYVQRLVGVHLVWYHITDWMGLASVAAAVGFAALGLYQVIKGKRLRRVDAPILLLGGFYILLMAVYFFFETVVINFRPVILDKLPEASYPSSHTVMAVCIMSTGAKLLRCLYPKRRKLLTIADSAAAVIISVTVLGRFISGVHWFTDIVGGLLLAFALTELYRGACCMTGAGPWRELEK